MLHKLVTKAALLSLPLFLLGATRTNSRIAELPSTQYGEMKLHVITAQGDAAQAAAYVNEDYLPALFTRLKTQSGPVLDLIKSVTAKNCDADAETACGILADVEDGNTVLYSYERGGWMSAGATYRSFLTWTENGSGHSTTPALAIEFTVSSEARDDTSSENPEFDVTIQLTGIEEIAPTPLRPIEAISPEPSHTD